MADKLKIAELTSHETREHLTEDAVIVLPMGSLEDQVVHAPMGDYLAADAVALDMARAARGFGIPTFLAPVIPFGGKDYFDSSHGGILIRLSTLIALIDDMVDGLVRHGLRKILILNGHAGNVPAIAEVTVRWRQKEGVLIPSMYLWQIAYQLLPQILGAETAKRSSGHGGDPLTSMGLQHYPEILRPDLMRPPATDGQVKGMEISGFAAIRYGGVNIQAPVEAAETAPDGIWMGDPWLSSADTGGALTAQLVDIGASLIRDHIAPGFPEGALCGSVHSLKGGADSRADRRKAMLSCCLRDASTLQRYLDDRGGCDLGLAHQRGFGRHVYRHLSVSRGRRNGSRLESTQHARRPVSRHRRRDRSRAVGSQRRSICGGISGARLSKNSSVSKSTPPHGSRQSEFHRTRARPCAASTCAMLVKTTNFRSPLAIQPSCPPRSRPNMSGCTAILRLKNLSSL